MKVIRWGVLSTAKIAHEHVARAIHAASDAELVALATAHPDKAAPFREFCPGLRLHDDYDALLADPEIDAVYVPLPNHLHTEWTLRAIAAGKPVLTEKPIGLDVADIDRIIAARDKAGILAAEAYMIVHHPQWQRVREWIAAGEIGTIMHTDAVFTFRLTDGDNIRNRPETAGGSLRDIGVYTFGSVRFVTGAEPATLDCRVIRDNGIDSFAHVTGVMEGNGHRFTYASTTSMRSYPRQVVTIQGTTGMIRVEGGPFNAGVNDIARIELHTKGNRTLVERFPGVDQYRLQVENFGRTLRDGTPFPCPLEFSRGTQRMMDTAYAVAREFGA